MKALKLIDLTDEQFQKYMELLEKIKKKYEVNSIILDYDWDEYRDYYFKKYSDWKQFKNERLEILKNLKSFSLNEFVIFDSDCPVAWIAYKTLSGKRHQFIFDFENDEIPSDVLKKLLEIINNFLVETGNGFMEYYANDNIKTEIFSKLGIEITENSINTILRKKDIDFEKLENIVSSNQHAQNYNLILYKEIPEEIYDRYVDFINEVLVAKEFYNPVKKKIKEYTKDDLLRRVQNDKEDGDPMYVFVLFDKENIVGFCSVYIQKEDEDVFIQHCGGFTAVAIKYRGRNFAKYLKAKMYLKIYEDYPNFRHALTDTYPWNKYMFRINEDLGFKILCEGCIFKFTKENLEKIWK